jgi:hypothetical protein
VTSVPVKQIRLTQALQTYFDGLYGGDTRKLAADFHDQSHLFSVTDGKLDDMRRALWFEMVRNRPLAATCRGAIGWYKYTGPAQTRRSQRSNVRFRHAISWIT